MKYNLKCILAVLLSTQLLLCSCANKPMINNSQSAVSEDSFELNTFNYKDQLSIYTDQVLDAINTQDRNALYDAFCPKVREEYSELANDIDKAFEFLGGEIQTYEKPELLSEGETFGGGHTSRLTGESTAYEVTTQNDVYKVFIGIVLVCDEKPSEVGIQNIKIYNLKYDIDDENRAENMVSIGDFWGSWYG